MAICFAPLSASFSGGGCQLKAREMWWSSSSRAESAKLTTQSPRKNIQLQTNRNFAIRAEYSDDSRGGGADFLAGFVLGGAVFGTLAYVFAPQLCNVLISSQLYIRDIVILCQDNKEEWFDFCFHCITVLPCD
ncbi:PREDICTED: unknown [Prunus dulcis]|uniref:Uncharacterized protein n=1 Tax=Prunus dulcis TaxID=3755 RepID=A0A5E4ECN6_PRUDU|nr:PREDICTED: unknown [Prunus dulcis]